MPRRLTPVLLAIPSVWLAPAAHAQIAKPSLTEINLAAVPFGQYLSNANPGPMPACPYNTSATVQSCVQSALASYESAGVTGVRVMFSFCPNPSNPDDVEALTSCNPSQASVNQSWASNVNAFMGDVASAGIQRVTLSPIFWGWTMFSHPPSQTYSPDPCFGGTVTLYWEGSAPFGQFIAGHNSDGSPIYYPWPQDFNNGYNCSPENPNFVGWQPLFNVISTVIQKAYNHNLTVEEIDVSQEIDLFNFTVEGRLITDNKSGDEDLIWNLAYYMSNDSNNTYDALRVTYSGREARSTSNQSPPYDCGSVYGDSARILGVSEIYAGIGGSVIGEPWAVNVSNGLPCGGSIYVNGNPQNGLWMISLPNDHSPPDILDLHSYPCLGVPGSPDQCVSGQSSSTIQAEANQTFSDAMSFIASFGPNGWRGYDPNIWNSPFMLGETHSNNYTMEPSSGTTCEGNSAPASAPWATVGGFNEGKLAGRYANGSPGTIFRPWNYPEWSCYLFPNPMGPYYAK